MARMDEIVEFVKRSKIRSRVLEALGKSILTANKVASRTDINVKTVRSAILDLRGKGLVKKATRGKQRPMIYETTKLGSSVLLMRDSRGRMMWKGTNKQKRISRRVKDNLHNVDS